MKQEPRIGEKVWIRPAKGLVVPMPVALRKNVTPADNKYRTAPLPKLDEAREVVWRSYWRRMLVRGEIEYAEPPKAKPKKVEGGNK